MDAYERTKEAIEKYSDMGDDVKMFISGGYMIIEERVLPIVKVGPLKLSTEKELEYAKRIAKKHEVSLEEHDFGDLKNPDYKSIFSKVFPEAWDDEKDRTMHKSIGLYYPEPTPQEDYDKCAKGLYDAEVAYHDKLRELKRIV